MDKNRRRYSNVIKKMNLQDEEMIGEALRKKGFYTGDDTYPLSSLHFELTYKCNAHCRHCYNNSGEGSASDLMTPQNWIDFSKYLVERGGMFECLLSGGEPLLLGEKLLDIMDILHDDGTIFLLMSNGQLLTEEMVKKLKKYRYHWLQVSIDGAKKEYHDWFRERPGCWESAIKGATAVANRGIPLKIAHCVTRYNLNEIGEMCDLAYSIGASSIMIGQISLSGRVERNCDLLLGANEIETMKCMVAEAREKYKGRMKVKFANSVKSGLKNHSIKPRSGAIIRPNGDIRIDGMAPFVIGNVLKDDFTDIWERKMNNCWRTQIVQDYIAGFDESDRNLTFVNYGTKDIFL